MDQSSRMRAQVPARPRLNASKVYRVPSYDSSPSGLPTSEHSCRKRPRSMGDDYFTTPRSCNTTNKRPSLRSNCSSTAVSPFMSPPTLVNTEYLYAGGFDTPGTEALTRCEDEDEDEDNNFENEFGRRRNQCNASPQNVGRQVFKVGALSRERNGGRKRRRDSTPKANSVESWGSYVVRLAGGIAGSLWTFCSEAAFTGFEAGPGMTYNWQNMQSPESEADQSLKRESTPIPGQFPDDYETVDKSSQSAEMEARPAKRRQTGHSRDDEWMMVDRSSLTAESLDAKPKSTQSPLSTIIHHSRLPRYSPKSRPSLDRQPQHHSSASTARLFSSTILPQSSRPASPHRAASYASPRAAVTTARQGICTPKKLSPTNKSSPISVDIEEYTKKREREERQADVRMRRMNQQLKAMIAEGQQALALKVESPLSGGFNNFDLEDEGYGEGYASDEVGLAARSKVF